MDEHKARSKRTKHTTKVSLPENNIGGDNNALEMLVDLSSLNLVVKIDATRAAYRITTTSHVDKSEEGKCTNSQYIMF